MDSHISGERHLFEAVFEGRVRKARIILEASDGVLDTARDDNGHTLLIATCFIENPSTRNNMLDMLLDRKLDMNRRDLKGRTVLSHACEMGLLTSISYLIRRGNVDPDAADSKGDTPLMYATRACQPDVMKLLIQNFRRLGLKVDHVNDEGYTALLLAARLGYLECCRILVEQGTASSRIRDKEFQRLPLDWMLQNNFEATCLEFLRPKSKFYCAAKFASSLVRARTVASFDKSSLKSARASKHDTDPDSSERTIHSHSLSKKQKSEDYLKFLRRGKSNSKCETHPTTQCFTTLATQDPADVSKESTLTKGSDIKPKRRRSKHKLRESKSRKASVTMASQGSVEDDLPTGDDAQNVESPLKSKKRGKKRSKKKKISKTEVTGSVGINITLLSRSHEMSWSSVSSLVTSVESLSLSSDQETTSLSEEA